MTDKIITTLETNLTWYVPSDLLPDKDCRILIFTEDKKIHLVDFLVSPYVLPYVNFYSIDREVENCWEINEVEWWSYLPEISEFN